MNQLASIVGFVGGESKGESREQDDWRDAPISSGEIKAKIKTHVQEIFEFTERSDDQRLFDEVERGGLLPLLFALGRLLLAYFLALRDERSGDIVAWWCRKGYRRRKPGRKYLGSFFGQVCFWRTYVRRPGGQGLRGTGDLHAWSDSSLYLRSQRADIVLTIEHRSEPTPPPVSLRLVSPADGPPHLEVSAPPTQDEPAAQPPKLLNDRVVEALRNGPLSRAALRDRLSVKNERLGVGLAELEQAQKIVRRPDGWALPDDQSTPRVPCSPFPNP